MSHDVRVLLSRWAILVILWRLEGIHDAIILTIYVLHHVDELLLVFIRDGAAIAALHHQRCGLMKPRTD